MPPNHILEYFKWLYFSNICAHNWNVYNACQMTRYYKVFVGICDQNQPLSQASRQLSIILHLQSWLLLILILILIWSVILRIVIVVMSLIRNVLMPIVQSRKRNVVLRCPMSSHVRTIQTWWLIKLLIMRLLLLAMCMIISCVVVKGVVLSIIFVYWSIWFYGTYENKAISIIDWNLHPISYS